jgi:arylsulfatase A-like enzyme
VGKEALACYGNDANKTPHLDALAASGIRFTRAQSTPLCSPSRVELMTGKYNNRNYLVFGIMDSAQKTFGEYLKQAGYSTGISGKWQLLGHKAERERAGGRIGTRPEQEGFDQYCLWQVEKIGSRYKDPTITSATSGTQTYTGHYGPDMFADYAVQFIRQNRDRPFFLYYPMVLTHAPFQPTPHTPDYGAMPPKGVDDAKYFPDQVKYMDQMVGRVMDEVDRQGLTTNTLIIFAGDNGTGRQVTSPVHGQNVLGGKGQTTIYGTNVPLLISWKGKIKPGQVNDNLVDFTDFLPTFLQVVKQPVPSNAGLDGVSLLPQLLGQPGPKRDYVFCFYQPRLRNDKKSVWAHDKRWKLYADGRFLDMEKDPLERAPLTDDALTTEARQAKGRLQGVITDKLTHGEQAGVQDPRKAGL